MGKLTETIKILLIINVIFFVGTMLSGTADLFTVWYPENPKFHFWQVITHMFMHSQTFYGHIIFNMLGLWMFGTPLEQIWGRNKFIFFYFSAGLGAYALSVGIDYFNVSGGVEALVNAGYDKNSIMEVLAEGKYNKAWAQVLGQDKLESILGAYNMGSLGASGAIMGLLVGFGMLFPNTPLMLIFLPIPIKAKYFIPAVVLLDIILGFTGGASIFGANIAHWAHVGGAFTGLIIAYYWKKNNMNTHRWN
tara:strand:- start:64253 stop:64999 length:747 start_codon:yes stop_codon:yes gene_type:complete